MLKDVSYRGDQKEPRLGRNLLELLSVLLLNVTFAPLVVLVWVYSGAEAAGVFGGLLFGASLFLWGLARSAEVVLNLFSKDD